MAEKAQKKKEVTCESGITQGVPVFTPYVPAKKEFVLCEMCGHSNPIDTAICEMCSNYLTKEAKWELI